MHSYHSGYSPRDMESYKSWGEAGSERLVSAWKKATESRCVVVRLTLPWLRHQLKKRIASHRG